MSQKILIQDIVAILAKVDGMNEPRSAIFVKEFFKLIDEFLECDGVVCINGLGTFKRVSVKEGNELVPPKSEQIIAKDHFKTVFFPELFFEDQVNRPYAHLEPQILDNLEDLSNAPTSYIYDQVKEKTFITNEESLNDYPVVEEVEIVTNRDKIQQEKPVSLIEPASKEESTLDKVQSGQKEQKVERELDLIEIYRENTVFQKEAATEFETAVFTRFDEFHRKKAKGKSRLLVSLGLILVVVAFLLISVTLISTFSPDFLKTKRRHEISEMTFHSDSLQDKEVKVKKDFDSSPILDKFDLELVDGKYVAVIRDSMQRKYYSKGCVDSAYVIKKNETLLSISRRFYGKKDLWPYILKENKTILKEPNKLPVGLVIRIPNLFEKK